MAGLLCRVEQILTYVGNLRPKRDGVIGDVLVTDTIKVDKAAAARTFSKRITSIKDELSAQKKETSQAASAPINYIAKVMDAGADDHNVKLMEDRKNKSRN